MRLLAIGLLDHVAVVHVPDSNTLVKRASSDKLAIRRHRNGGDAIFDGEGNDAAVLLDVPDSDGPIARSGSNVDAVAGEVERIDVLLVAGELVANLALFDVPDLLSREPRFSVCSNTNDLMDGLTRMILSSAPVARYLPSGLKHTLRM